MLLVYKMQGLCRSSYEYKNGTYDDMDGIEILNSFGINCRHISASATEEKREKD